VIWCSFAICQFIICRFAIVGSPYEPVCNMPVRHMRTRTRRKAHANIANLMSAHTNLTLRCCAHVLRWRHANLTLKGCVHMRVKWAHALRLARTYGVIWRTDYGESTVANRHMTNWHMAKRHIPKETITIKVKSFWMSDWILHIRIKGSNISVSTQHLSGYETWWPPFAAKTCRSSS